MNLASQYITGFEVNCSHAQHHNRVDSVCCWVGWDGGGGGGGGLGKELVIWTGLISYKLKCGVQHCNCQGQEPRIQNV